MITANILNVIVEPRAHAGLQILRGVSILTDEIALKEAAVYFPSENGVGGLCWKHTHCYSPYSFTPRLFVLFLVSHSSPVGNTFLRLVSLYVPCRTHFFLPFPLVTDLTPFSELPTGRGLIRSSLLTFSC
jgi:hypothetical protein